jgi:hypothetical protein
MRRTSERGIRVYGLHALKERREIELLIRKLEFDKEFRADNDGDTKQELGQ